MTIPTKKLATTTAATFAAAFTSIYAAPELQAQALELVPSASTVTSNNSTSVGFLAPEGTAFSSMTFVGSAAIINFSTARNINTVTGLTGFAVVSDTTLSTATFTPDGALNITSLLGTQFIGFRTEAGDVGYFTLDLGDGLGSGAIGVSGGQVGQNGAPVTVPSTTPVPEPASGLALAALALGAAGIRRKRQVA